MLLAQSQFDATSLTLGVILGAVSGFAGGLAVEFLWKYYVEWPREAKATAERQFQLLKVLQSSLSDNQSHVDQIEEWFNKDGIPSFNVDVTPFVYTSELRYELLNSEICREVDVVRFQLDHLARKIDSIFDIHNNPTSFALRFGDKNFYDEAFAKVKIAVVKQLPTIRKHIKAAKELVDGAISEHERKGTGKSAS